MTVKQLIKVLADLPQDIEVVVPSPDAYPQKLSSVRVVQGTWDGMGGAFIEGRGGKEEFAVLPMMMMHKKGMKGEVNLNADLGM